MRPWTWEQLATATLARQFPRVRGRGESAVVELIRRVGPIQSQAARAPFLAIAARLPGASYQVVSAVHESLQVVRSTSLRGTVHTSTRDQHGALAAVAVRSLTPGLRRTLQLDDEQLAGFRAELERLARAGWTPHNRLLEGVIGWMRREGLNDSEASLQRPGGLYSLRGHPDLLRRPVRTGAGWESQAEVAYWSARTAIAEPRLDPQQALVSLVRDHVRASGPVTRRDLAWWSGAGLRQVDAAVATMSDELESRPGPGGLEFLDLASGGSPGASGETGLRLLPEYDALLLAYDPAGRDRFADEAAVRHSWNRANGVHSPTVLVDGRLRGRWRLTRHADQAAVAVEMFPGERLLDPGDLTDAVAALQAVLEVEVTDVLVTRLGGRT